MYVCLYVCIYLFIYIRVTLPAIFIYIYCLCMQVCMYVCMYVFTYICVIVTAEEARIVIGVNPSCLTFVSRYRVTAASSGTYTHAGAGSRRVAWRSLARPAAG